ncbi:MAG TPA: hypothetical protein VHX42_02900, partial [Candidatus Babeliales bacterium]|nr:hypothetical protein [Candidatus Babeliales bacterium]
MKKYRAPLALFLCVFCHATAMEKVCYLNRMPRDILDYIAIFLTCDDETEEQFIARTFAEKQKKDDYYYENAHHEVCMPNLCLAAKNKKKQRISLKEDGARLALFDGSKVYEYKGLAKSGYECCALSPSGTMIAIFHRQFLPGEKYKTAILEILKMGTEDIPEQENGNLIVEKRRKLLRRNYKTSFNDIAFNKQGQHLIAWN